MYRIILVLILAVFCYTAAFADDVDIKAGSNNGTTGVSVKDSGDATVLKVTSDGDLAQPAGAYHNFGDATAVGEAGYGIRDNAGTLQTKNSGGTWSPLTTTGFTPTYGEISYKHGNGTFDVTTGLYGVTGYNPTVTTNTYLTLQTSGVYYNCFPCTGSNSYYYSSVAEGVTIELSGGLPIAIRINTSGVYRISSFQAVCGTGATNKFAAVEFEISKSNSLPAFSDGTAESLSSVVATNKASTDQTTGSFSGFLSCSAGDIIQLGNKRLLGNETIYYVYAINLAVERVK